MIRFVAPTALAAAGLSATVAMAQPRPADATAPVPVRDVSVTVDARKSLGPLPPAWRFFGADEPNYATMKDGRKLLVELGDLKRGEVFFRAHNLLSTGDGTAAFKWGSTNAYTEGPDGKPVYDWTIVDNIIDTYLARGVRPYLQIGFMPEALSTAPKGTPYQHSWRPGFDYRLIATGWTYPPDGYDKWAELVYQWTRHNVERYGADEVNRWYFEVWNEPDSKFYWQASPEEFNKLHDFAIDAVRRALPTAKVGGPDVAVAGEFMDGFLRHVASGRNYVTGRTGTSTDFLSFHAKGAPSFVDGHVRMGLSTHLRNVDRGFAKVAGFPALAAKPIVIGESDPEGCAACPGPQNAYRNGTMYSSYTAASFARIWDLAARRKVNIEGILSWSFEFEDQPWFAGYRQLSTNGVDLPVLNIFRMFAKMGPERIAATSSAQVPLDAVVKDGVRGQADIGTLATRTPDGRIAVLLWHYHDDDVAGPVAQVKLDIAGAKAGPVRLWRVDGSHANAFTAWQRMGSPQSPDEKQYARLESASKMQEEAVSSSANGRGGRSITVQLPRQGVALLTLDGR
ncbi:beta-xylosidase [Sphingomonas sp. Leaf24]|uniref:GH39 family glycosyl hydrolase n=1 Tax=unclassified Sphingomonas TaxID=196159 RepID=UPI0006F75B25|nr:MULTISPECIES: beta-xylosidase [unclassified Sphingomonas]KQM12898.1 beta-xylosidase [Sphingomonas sp. Leaf5]KQM94536.1 beta-xylosidase [Sphingomonas sp. Leaf24]